MADIWSDYRDYQAAAPRQIPVVTLAPA